MVGEVFLDGIFLTQNLLRQGFGGQGHKGTDWGDFFEQKAAKRAKIGEVLTQRDFLRQDWTGFFMGLGFWMESLFGNVEGGILVFEFLKIRFFRADGVG